MSDKGNYNPKLAIAMAVRKRMVRKANGGIMKPSEANMKEDYSEKEMPKMYMPRKIVEGVMRKKMMKDGGMVEKEADDNEDDWLSPDAEDDSDEVLDIDASYPDPDGVESDDALDEKGKRKKMIAGMFRSSS